MNIQETAYHYTTFSSVKINDRPKARYYDFCFVFVLRDVTANDEKMMVYEHDMPLCLCCGASFIHNGLPTFSSLLKKQWNRKYKVSGQQPDSSCSLSADKA